MSEVLGFEPAGEGEHLLVHIEKRGLTTQQAAKTIARAFGVQVRNVGWAGLKDKHAVTRQTLSVPWPIKRELPNWHNDDEALRVLGMARHNRKLRAGSHAANAFVIDCDLDAPVDQAALQARVAEINAGGMPNGFGAQRFGRGGDNVAQFLSIAASERCPGILISAARSLVFNTVLDTRIAAGTWNTALAGDWMMLDGSNSGFAAVGDLSDRLSSLDIHPSGPLPGTGEPKTNDVAAELEAGAEAACAEVIDRLSERGVTADRRALRIRVGTLEASALDAQTVRLRFELPPGSFATSLVDQFFTSKPI